LSSLATLWGSCVRAASRLCLSLPSGRQGAKWGCACAPPLAPGPWPLPPGCPRLQFLGPALPPLPPRPFSCLVAKGRHQRTLQLGILQHAQRPLHPWQAQGPGSRVQGPSMAGLGSRPSRAMNRSLMKRSEGLDLMPHHRPRSPPPHAGFAGDSCRHRTLATYGSRRSRRTQSERRWATCRCPSRAPAQ